MYKKGRTQSTTRGRIMCTKGFRIQVDTREPAILTAELTYLGYEVEDVQLEAGDFQEKTT